MLHAGQKRKRFLPHPAVAPGAAKRMDSEPILPAGLVSERCPEILCAGAAQPGVIPEEAMSSTAFHDPSAWRR